MGRSAAVRYEPTLGTIRRHPALLVAEVLVSAPVVGVTLLVIVTVLRRVAPEVPVALPAALLIALWLYVAWIRWASGTLTLTDTRVVLTKGVLSQLQRTIPFEKIQYVGVRQSILGRLIGFGTLEIGVAGYADPHRFGPAPVRVMREHMLIPLD